jgi:Flp pilus assembly protein TadG
MTCLPRRLVARFKNDRGANLVEAALITPLLLMITFAIIEFGALFYVYLALEHGVGEATRYAVTGQAQAGQTREASIKQAMRNAARTLELPDDAFAFSYLPPTATVGTPWIPGTGGPGDIGKVAVTYTWDLYTPLIRPFFDNGRITLVVESAMRNEQYIGGAQP